MSKLVQFFTKAYNFIRFDVWRMTEFELSRTKKLLYRFVRIIILATRGFFEDRLNARASALTYSILFAVVPMFALIIAIGRGFGMEDLIEKWLQDSFIAQAEMIPTVMNFVKRYLETTQGGVFIGVGIGILLFSVINFFMQVEFTFNTIWQVKKARSVGNQLTMYFSAMLIIPVFIVLSSGVSIYLNTILSKTIVYQLFSPFQRFTVNITPYAINWFIFTIMYMVIPNTKVKFVNALIAGILAGSAFQIFQILYINGQVYLSRYNVVYGSFAAIPLLLLWLQISCLIVLLGAEISYASQNIINYEYEVDSKHISPRYKNFLTLFISYIIVKQFENQEKPYTAYRISQEYKLPLGLVNQILDKLTETNIITESYCADRKTKTYLPSFDINKLTVNLLFEKIDSFGTAGFLYKKNEALDQFDEKTKLLFNPSDISKFDILIKDI